MSDSSETEQTTNVPQISEYNFNTNNSNDTFFESNTLPNNSNISNSMESNYEGLELNMRENDASNENLNLANSQPTSENETYDAQISSQSLYVTASNASGQISASKKDDDDSYEALESNMKENGVSNENVNIINSLPTSENEIYDAPLTSQSLYAAASAVSGQSLASKKDDDDRKIFVGGLHWETNIDDLKEYFGSYGLILDVTLKTDVATGRSRGFGFVLFDDISSVDKVMEQKVHVLHGKTIDPKRAVTRLSGMSGPPISRDPCKKIFVGGISPDMPEAEIRNFFSKYGKVEEVELPFDRVKNMRRAYVFLTFENEKCAEEACILPKQKIGEREVDVRKATPRSENQGQKGMEYPGMYPPGYDYSQYYGSYGYGFPGYPGYGQAPGYDYSAYYNQDWSQYATQYPQQYGYPPTAYPAATAYPQGYDYSAWYAAQGQQPPQQGQQPSSQMPPANGQTTGKKKKVPTATLR